MMHKYYISSAYIYPVCPLNINHARMFVIADIFARYRRKKGYQVFFPIASHYSGNTAHKVATELTTALNTPNKTASHKVWQLYRNFYNTPELVLREFTNPVKILDFYTQEILWELRSLDVSGNYEAFYTTHQDDFSAFIQAVIKKYKDKHLLVNNAKNELALDYDNSQWTEETKNHLSSTIFEQKFHKNNILGVLKNNNLRNDWSFLRNDGLGATYKNKWVIDPMFDSELFTVFDIYAKFSSESGEKLDSKKFLDLFDVLSGKRQPLSNLENMISNWLPCDLFICEEHLKNWMLKKLYAETALLREEYRTKNYFVLGMGRLNGKRISASRGNAILASDLINEYGSTKSRLIMLMQGGHPSKMYSYNNSVSNEIDKMLKIFNNFYLHLLMRGRSKQKTLNTNSFLKKISIKIEHNIEKGYFRQAILDLLVVIPKNYNKEISDSYAQELLQVYNTYLEVIVPSLARRYQNMQ